MKKISFNAEYEVYEDETQLPPAAKKLLQKAKEACQTAYAPYSNFKVGAAVQLANGEIVKGSNQENAAFPVTICGERNAVFAAAAQYPGVQIEAVAITAETVSKELKKPVPPCGSCRQVLFEYEFRQQQPIQLILQGDAGEVYIVKAVKDILPLLFDASYLKK
jgi:cytidine deaminase